MKGRYTRLVSLWLRTDDVAAFEDFERRASRLLARHGGRIEHAIRPLRGATDAQTPFEIHVVSFADPQGFAAYRADPDVHALGAERETIIARTTVIEGHETGRYDA